MLCTARGAAGSGDRLLLGECRDDGQLESLQAVAKSQGFIWVECALSGGASTAQKLREFLLRAHAGREKLLLYGYPRTAAQAADLIKLVQFAILDSSSASPVAPDLVAVFDAQPKIMQLDLTSSPTASASIQSLAAKLRSTFFRKQIVAVTGSVGALDLRQLRAVVAPLGYGVIQLQQNDNDECELIHELERRVQAVQSPRCLVVRAPETPSFYHALEAHIGRAMLKILILQHVPARGLRMRRTMWTRRIIPMKSRATSKYSRKTPAATAKILPLYLREVG